jgi:hypothetical protein
MASAGHRTPVRLSRACRRLRPPPSSPVPRASRAPGDWRARNVTDATSTAEEGTRRDIGPPGNAGGMTSGPRGPGAHEAPAGRGSPRAGARGARAPGAGHARQHAGPASRYNESIFYCEYSLRCGRTCVLILTRDRSAQRLAADNRPPAAAAPRARRMRVPPAAAAARDGAARDGAGRGAARAGGHGGQHAPARCHSVTSGA